MYYYLITMARPRYNASLEMDIDTGDMVKLIDGFGRKTQQLLALSIDAEILMHLDEIKQELVDGGIPGLPHEVNLDDAIYTDVKNGRGTITIDTRLGVGRQDLSDAPTQEKKNIAWFLEYGRGDGENARPFLRPLVELKNKNLERKIANVVIDKLAANIAIIKMRGYEVQKSNPSEARKLFGSTGGFTTALNKIRALYGENVPTE